MPHVRGPAAAARRRARALQRGFLPTCHLAAKVALSCLPVGFLPTAEVVPGLDYCCPAVRTASPASPSSGSTRWCDIEDAPFAVASGDPQLWSDAISFSGDCGSSFTCDPGTGDTGAGTLAFLFNDDAPALQDVACQTEPVLHFEAPGACAVAASPSCLEFERRQLQTQIDILTTTVGKLASHVNAKVSELEVGMRSLNSAVVGSVPAPAFESKQLQIQVDSLAASFSKLTDHVNSKCAGVALRVELDEAVTTLNATLRETVSGLKGSLVALVRDFTAQSHGGLTESLSSALSAQAACQMDALAGQLKVLADGFSAKHDRLANDVLALQIAHTSVHYDEIAATFSDPDFYPAFLAATCGAPAVPCCSAYELPFAAVSGASEPDFDTVLAGISSRAHSGLDPVFAPEGPPRRVRGRH